MATSAMSGSIVSEGPFGGPGGSGFYDGVGDIVGIKVSHNKRGIVGLQTTYQQGDKHYKSIDHGIPGDGEGKLEELEFPTEYLMRVEGMRGKQSSGYDIITSLTFITNKRILGPYGVPGEEKFQSSPHSMVVGFFGKASAMLDSIGVFTKPYSCCITSQEGRAGKIVEISVDHKADTISIKTYPQGNGGC